MGFSAYVTDPITLCVECRSNAVLLGGKSNVIETTVFISLISKRFPNVRALYCSPKMHQYSYKIKYNHKL
jgi:hypothetical protein